LGESKE